MLLQQDVANVNATDYFNQQYKQYIGWTNLPHAPICPSLPYFANFFTSYKLLSELSDKGVKATGTIRETRIANATKKIINSKDIKKEERGTFNFCSDEKVYLAKWHDNSIVTIASNWENHEPVYKVRRRFKRGENQVSQPHLVWSYNKGMGGVDQMDRLAKFYR